MASNLTGWRLFLAVIDEPLIKAFAVEDILKIFPPEALPDVEFYLSECNWEFNPEAKAWIRKGASDD